MAGQHKMSLIRDRDRASLVVCGCVVSRVGRVKIPPTTYMHSGNVGPDLGLGRINGEKGGDTKPQRHAKDF